MKEKDVKSNLLTVIHEGDRRFRTHTSNSCDMVAKCDGVFANRAEQEEAQAVGCKA